MVPILCQDPVDLFGLPILTVRLSGPIAVIRVQIVNPVGPVNAGGGEGEDVVAVPDVEPEGSTPVVGGLIEPDHCRI